MDKNTTILVNSIEMILYHIQCYNDAINNGRTANIYRLKIKKQMYILANQFNVSYSDIYTFLINTVDIDVPSLFIEL